MLRIKAIAKTALMFYKKIIEITFGHIRVFLERFGKIGYHFINNRNTRMFWGFCNFSLLAFSTGSEMSETLLRYCWSTSIPRFGTTLTKKVSKVFAVLHSLLINRKCYINVVKCYI